VPGWDTFAVIIGGAAGALIGLLFVWVSIRIEVISASPDFRNRGAATLSLFTTVLLVAVLLGIPGQHQWQLGVELLVLAVVLGGWLLWLDRRATASPSTQSISRVLATVSPGTLTTLLLAVAGVLLLAGVDDGVYVVVPSVIAAITGGVASAWLFLTRITAS
jgi:hypothetical protein